MQMQNIRDMGNTIVSTNVSKIRKTLGYTQNSIAQFLGISQAAYSKYESGELDIPISVIENLANLFGIDEYDFYEENADLQLANAIFAFRADDIVTEDMISIAKFKKIVRNYINMSNELDKRRN